MSDVFTNQQVSELLGIQPSTLRTWKSRKPDLLQEGIHWLKSEDNSTLWTETGIEVLRQLCSGTVSSPETVLSQPETPDETNLTTRYAPIVDTVSDILSEQLLRRIDAAVVGRVKHHLTKPMTANERVSVLSQLGLKAANPELLLQQSTSNYLPEGEN